MIEDVLGLLSLRLGREAIRTQIFFWKKALTSWDTQAIGRQFLAGANWVEGRWRRTEAVGRADHQHHDLGGVGWLSSGGKKEKRVNNVHGDALCFMVKIQKHRNSIEQWLAVGGLGG